MKRILIIVLAMLLLTGCSRQQAQVMPPSKATVKPKTPEEIARAESEIRYAISLLLDRNYIADSISQAGEIPASSFVAMGMTDFEGDFYENAGNNTYPGYFDTEAYGENFRNAVSILQKYYDFNGCEFENFPALIYIYNNNHKNKATAEYVQAVLKMVGISVVTENQEWNSFLSTRKSGNYSIARAGWVADYTDPICFLEMWTSDSGNNDIGLGRGDHAQQCIYDLDLQPYGLNIAVENGTWAETYDVLIREIKKCTDSQTRFQMMHLAEDMLMATGCVVPLYFYTDIYMLDQRVTGFYSNPLGSKYFHKTLLDGAGEELSVCLSSEPESLDPGLSATVDGATILAHLFSGLAKWEQVGERLSIVPDCAESLPEPISNEDGTVTYTYKLKSDLKWSDGKPLTAADFAYAWKRAADPSFGSDYGYLFRSVKGYPNDLAVEATDELTLTVTLTSALPYWNELLAFPTFYPVRQDVVSNEAWATDSATYIGNGPYTMTAWKHDARITLMKNPNYHATDTVTMNTLQLYLSDDANNMLTNFRKGDWHLIDDVPANEIRSLKANSPEAFYVSPQIGTNYLCFNVNTPLLPQ